MNRWPASLAAVALLAAVPLEPAQAQVGIKGGVSHGNISNSGALPGDLGSRTGFTVGLSVASAPTSVVGLGLEGMYTQRGANSAGNASSFELDYVDVPLYLRLAVPSPGLQPFVYAGPQVSFEVRCRTGVAECEDDSDRPSITYAGVIGAGLRLGEASGLSVEGRYVYGLRDLDLGTVTDEQSYKHRSFQFLLGFNFYNPGRAR
jgi:hypothetical protein